MTRDGWDQCEPECTCDHQKLIKGGLRVFLRGSSLMLKSIDVEKSGQSNFGEVMIAYLLDGDVRPFYMLWDLVLGAC